MAQHDYVIANGTGAAVRSDLNDAFAAIVSQNSGTSEPATTYAYQWWADTTTGLLKIRNAANNAWVTVGTLADANLGLLSSGSTITAALGTASTPGITFTGDLNTGIYSPGADQVAISTNGTERVEFGTSEVVFNDGGANYDFRIEGDTEANLFFVDASTDRVGLGTSSPSALLHLSSATGSSAPTPTELRIATTTNAGDWSTTSPWGRISYYSDDASDAGPKIVAAIDSVASTAGGGRANFDFKLAEITTGTLTSRFTITSAGNVGIGTSTFTANGGVLELSGGITFPATAVAASNANTLDDYEEGTFTPILADNVSSANAATMTVQEGYYTKVGNVVTIQIQIVWSGKGSMGAGNNTRIYGIPFTAKNNTSGYYWPAPLTMSSGNSDFMAAQPGNEAVLVTILANSPTGELSTSYVSASGRLLVQYTYRTN